MLKLRFCPSSLRFISPDNWSAGMPVLKCMLFCHFPHLFDCNSCYDRYQTSRPRYNEELPVYKHFRELNSLKLIIKAAQLVDKRPITTKFLALARSISLYLHCSPLYLESFDPSKYYNIPVLFLISWQEIINPGLIRMCKG